MIHFELLAVQPKEAGLAAQGRRRVREGVTLIEVLVAIFIMALGMMALLTLFPLGALRMAQAIQDDRTASCATNANAIAIIKGIRNDPLVVLEPAPLLPTAKRDVDVFEADLDDYPFAPIAGPGPYPAPDPNGPSNPVMVDPAGVRMGQRWVGGLTGLIPRRDTTFTDRNTKLAAETYRWFTFLDDYEFDRTFGVPTPPGSREYNYSWAYMMRRPKASEPAVVDVSVMVFKRRPLILSGAAGTLREQIYLTYNPPAPAAKVRQVFDTTRNVVTIDYSDGKDAPSVRPGEWILDATVRLSPTGKRISHAYFYRVVSVTDISDTQLEIEVQTPLRGFPPGVHEGNVVVFEGLVEVFERGTGWK